ncbi:MAG: endo alpha-1,4 polygalactosaminidase [Sulfurovum sp.]|nr:endo alpha-1,4 polygalactosaminidase [Sulfurovum sp.]
MYIPVLLGSVAGSTNTSNEILPVYNQAYQENFKADTITEILTSAKNAYVLIDPFSSNIVSNIVNIKAKGNQIGGYISVGTGEDWRDDFDALEPYLTEIEWSEWQGEFYVSQTTTGILSVMNARIDKMASWGIDWVEYDNMDWLDTQSKLTFGLEATEVEARTYINALCSYTQQKGMKCMAKNTVEGFEHFDGVLYESYHNEKNWWDTKGTQNFINSGKLVIINHYNEIDCDGVYAEYKSFYKSKNISFICEDRATQKYRHYNQ